LISTSEPSVSVSLLEAVFNLDSDFIVIPSKVLVFSAGGQLLALQSYYSDFYWVHTDHLGSGRKLTSTSGTVVYRGEYDPHGQMIYEWSSSGEYYKNSRKYTGYERDWATNLDNAKARAFNHNRGRFMQPDPLGVGAADPSNPQSLNRYSYVGNDPANFVDPSGLLRALFIPGQACVDIGDGPRCETYYTVIWVDDGFGYGTPGGVLDQLGLLPQPGTTILRPDGEVATPCDLMAAAAQRAAEIALNQFPSNLSEAVKVFDKVFSNFYLGGNLGNNPLSAAMYYFNREANINSAAAGDYSSKPYRGYEGFKEGFRDSSVEGRNDDQTHHAAIYINAGIRGQGDIAFLHMMTDNNSGDKKLGMAAFMFGKSLARNPSALRDVGINFLRAFCN
jgi:RHS repeat-associated protein